MASSSSSIPLVMKDEEPRNWSELPSELTYSILLRLDAIEILENAQKVCRAWRRVSKEPSMWRKIDMRNCGICIRNAVDRSEGGLVEINIGNHGTDSILTYIADRSSNLKSLALGMRYPMTNNGLVNAVKKLPLLEVLEVSSETCEFLDLKAIGHSCPKLKTFKLNRSAYRLTRLKCDDDEALAIAESMPELRHLQLLGNRLTDTGLNAILDNCPHLEHLDIRKCLKINLSGDLEKLCLERIKDFRRPNDSTGADYPFDITFFGSDSDDDLDSIYGVEDFEHAFSDSTYDYY